MRVILAPMEGVLDHRMRQLLSELNPYDLCVTEFIRVIEQPIPDKVFYRLAPELENGGKTRNGTPVRVQLLGQDPDWLAYNAERAIALGSPGVDINFGCPAKTVNKSKGGAVLLKEPETLYRIVSAMRQAVPADQVLSAKIRLGWECTSQTMEIAQAIESAGANELAIHGRTKADGYRADAINWGAIAPVAKALSIPVIANGEINGFTDGQRCQAESGCQDLMIGRGALCRPNLGAMVKENAELLSWDAIREVLNEYVTLEVYGDKQRYFPNRIKQWFGYLRQAYPQANELFRELRQLQRSDEIIALLNQH
ncbi:tRNA dihydrouridine(16) synthase DusC [Ferrimonas balearica]|uniref:tRNA dihydrouridine(16) synthase DusC n=1 Tax=Ferrimonas balearica TaxID=44012 RepID=UPI001C5A1725|nr:tRNA dihydrouridine(16) synthase DusC [Ferrimonas balearica]MBW3164153.1 tRNA dihydrouridine(16) synthase DusC [Ferrimonas balearica]MBY6018380.1 tRNA dihydrouridine(16) synthase DusC [Halomonas denitrificans]